LARAALIAFAATLSVGCATTSAPPREPQAEKLGQEDKRFIPGQRVITREELESVGGQHDLGRALTILVPGLSIVRQ
jgi:hypothetical protein